MNQDLILQHEQLSACPSSLCWETELSLVLVRSSPRVHHRWLFQVKGYVFILRAQQGEICCLQNKHYT